MNSQLFTTLLPPSARPSDEWNSATIQGRLSVRLEAPVEFAYDGTEFLGIEDVGSVADIRSRLDNKNL